MKECIILAGGLGSRLGDIATNIPKCMVEVAGKPFLSYLFSYLEREKFEHIILSLGHQADIVLNWINSYSETFPFELSYVIEENPLGTGGAMKNALSKSKSDTLFIINGDTMFTMSTDNLKRLHAKKSADISLALKPMKDFDRYGYVTIDESERIVKFHEKSPQNEGLINGGIYILEKSVLSNMTEEVFSFEKDILEKRTTDLSLYGYTEDAYFMDIGTPDDYRKANIDFLNFTK